MSVKECTNGLKEGIDGVKETIKHAKEHKNGLKEAVVGLKKVLRRRILRENYVIKFFFWHCIDK